MQKKNTIAIIGGGPAGAYCAYKLAQKGFEPFVFDFSHPREKPCAGGIMPSVVKRFPFLEQFRFNGYSYGDTVIVSCTGDRFTTKGLQGGFTISRQYFDQELLNMAINNGAKHVKEKVVDVKNNGDLWTITTKSSEYNADILVGADGVNSIVRKKTIGSISKENLSIAFGYVAERLKEEKVIIRYLTGQSGYAWHFPGNGYANVGIASELVHGNKLPHLLDSFVKAELGRLKILNKYAAMIPIAYSPDFFRLPCAGKDWVLIGDAAGHVDCSSGGGIFYALLGAECAAYAIITGKVELFNQIWRIEYGFSLEESCRIKTIFNDPEKSGGAIASIVNNSF